MSDFEKALQILGSQDIDGSYVIDRPDSEVTVYIDDPCWLGKSCVFQAIRDYIRESFPGVRRVCVYPDERCLWNGEITFHESRAIYSKEWRESELDAYVDLHLTAHEIVSTEAKRRASKAEA